MIIGVNKVIIVGNLGQKPEIKYTADGRAIANLSIATSESWNDKKTGEKKERTEWHRVCLFGKLASIAGQYLDKGSKVYIEGKLRTRKWQDQNNQDRYITEIILSGFGDTLQMLDKRGTNETEQVHKVAKEKTPVKEITPVSDDDFDDDIPF